MNHENPDPFSDTRFDVRVIEHAIRRRSLTRDEVNTHLAALEDDAEHAVESHVRFHSSFSDRPARGRR